MNIDDAAAKTLKPRERILVAAFCALAALRVFAFSAAFPFFNNVDEQSHADLVMKYARGHWPRSPIEPFDAASARLFVLYGTPEYFDSSTPAPRPLWQASDGADALERGVTGWTRLRNHEAGAPPVYYATAAAWYRLGGALGLTGIERLYWVRFLNVALIAALVACGYAFCLWFYPDRLDLRLGVPALVACFPQDVFYSINSDVLSPLLSAGSLMLIWSWYRRERPGALFSVAVGFAVAASFLVKYTNFVVAVIFGAFALARIRRPSAIVTAAIAAVLPVAVIWLRNHAAFGDWTDTGAKAQFLGWSSRRLADWAAHPIFSLRGAWTFWSELMRTFWRGEIVWRLRPLASPYADAFYVNSSTVLLVAALVASTRARVDRGVHASVWASVVLSVLSLAFLSVRFEYGDSFYPSERLPFFVSGRLIGGMLVPFLVLYVDGIAFLLRPTSRVAGPLLFVSIACIIAIASELALCAPMFANPFNWFHLP